jgi:hypothetical protein
MKLALILALFTVPVMAQITAPQIPITATIGSGGVFPLLNSGSVSFASDANHTMTYPETSAFAIKVTSSATLTATRQLVAPSTFGYIFLIENATTGGQSITVGGSNGALVTILNGSSATVFSDGSGYQTTTGTGGSTACFSCILTTPTVSQMVTQPPGTTLSFANAYATSTLSDAGKSYSVNVSNANNVANPATLGWTANAITMNCVQQGEYLTGFWSGCTPRSTKFMSSVRSIVQGDGLTMTHNGVGDTFGEYDYLTFFGGNIQGDDEGIAGKKWQMHQIGYLSGTISNGFAGSTQIYGPQATGNTYINGRDIIPYTGQLGSITINFNASYPAPTAGTAHVYLNTRTPGTNIFTPTVDIPITIASTAAPQTFSLSGYSGVEGQYVSVYIASGTGIAGTSDAPMWGLAGIPTVGTATTFLSGGYGYASFSTTMVTPAQGATGLVATNLVTHGYNLANAGITFADGGTAYDSSIVIGTATIASRGNISSLNNQIYYNLATGSVTPSTAYGTIASCTPSNAFGLTNQQPHSTSCVVNVTSSGAFTTTGHIFLTGTYVESGEEATVTSVTTLSGGQQTIVFPSRGGAWNTIMQGGSGGQVMIATSTLSSWPITYWILGATSSMQVIALNCVQGGCSSLANALPGAPVSEPMTLSYGESMTRAGGTVTLSNFPFAVQNFGVGSTIIVTGATPTDLNGTFTVATNTQDTIGTVNVTWLQAGANESTTTNATFTAPNTGVTIYPSALITGTLSGATGGVQLGVNNVNWALGDTIVGAPSNMYSASGLFIADGQTTPVNGSYPSAGIVIQDDGPASLLSAITATNGAPAANFISADGQYQNYLNFVFRPINNGCLLCVFGNDAQGGAAKPYYIYQDHNTGFGGILADVLNYRYVVTQPWWGPQFVSTADPEHGGAANVLPGIIGDATAPSGTCTTIGIWMFTQDGHATFCNGTTWVTKI